MTTEVRLPPNNMASSGVIGGLVPGLLVLDAGAGRPSHVGTTDLDLCLSVALAAGDNDCK
jgi:hypothetical protein